MQGRGNEEGTWKTDPKRGLVSVGEEERVQRSRSAALKLNLKRRKASGENSLNSSWYSRVAKDQIMGQGGGGKERMGTSCEI